MVVVEKGLCAYLAVFAEREEFLEGGLDIIVGGRAAAGFALDAVGADNEWYCVGTCREECEEQKQERCEFEHCLAFIGGRSKGGLSYIVDVVENVFANEGKVRLLSRLNDTE